MRFILLGTSFWESSKIEMKPMIVQFGLTTLLVGDCVMTWKRARQRALRGFEAVWWSLLWVGAIILVWRPQTSTALAQWVGVGRGADLVLYVSVTLLLILVFQLHVAHIRLERTLTELIRRQALQEFEGTAPRVEIDQELHR